MGVKILLVAGKLKAKRFIFLEIYIRIIIIVIIVIICIVIIIVSLLVTAEIIVLKGRLYVISVFSVGVILTLLDSLTQAVLIVNVKGIASLHGIGGEVLHNSNAAHSLCRKRSYIIGYVVVFVFVHGFLFDKIIIRADLFLYGVVVFYLHRYLGIKGITL